MGIACDSKHRPEARPRALQPPTPDHPPQAPIRPPRSLIPDRPQRRSPIPSRPASRRSSLPGRRLPPPSPRRSEPMEADSPNPDRDDDQDPDENPERQGPPDADTGPSGT